MSKLKTLRKQKGLSQVEVARQAGIDTRQYQRYEYGEREPKTGVAIKLAKALETTVEELFR